MGKYYPMDPQVTPRFCGIHTFMRLPYIQSLEKENNNKDEKDIDFAVIGVPFDTASSFRTGSRFGPGAIRAASRQLRPYNINLGIGIWDYLSGIDFGDLPVVPGYIEDTYEKIEAGLAPFFQKDICPVVLGGDHSITLGTLRAVAKKYGKVALVHFDSHLDTIDEYFGKKFNHGTPFRRAWEEGLIDTSHSIQVGIRGNLYSPNDITDSEELGFKVLTATKMREMGFDKVVSQIQERAKDVPVFVSFDIDFVDPAYAPGTGTTEIGGFNGAETLYLLKGLQNLDIIGCDVVEVLPALDPTEITALMAANVTYELIALLAARKRDLSK